MIIDAWQTHIGVTHFLVYHPKEIIESDYKGKVQQPGKGPQKTKPVILGRVYKTNMPDDWEPKNQKNYWTAEWPQKPYTRMTVVNGPFEDFIEKICHKEYICEI